MIEKQYVPPYSITDKIINLVSEISEQVGKIAAKGEIDISPRLRRENQIRSISSSLAIENNTLSLEQVTDIINGKRVLGAPDEIREVKNAYEAYNLIFQLNPLETDDMLKAHKALMEGLIEEAGKFRSGDIGVFAGKRLVHMAPSAGFVVEHMNNLINQVRTSDVHSLIKSCVFHYEFEFIHPFSDGNGRMGRMWQTLLLSKWKSLFAWLPVEELVFERQQEYYEALAIADREADSAVFIEYMLQIIRDALHDLLKTEQVCEQVTVQVERLLEVLGKETLSAAELMKLLGLKHRQSFVSLYLRPALELGLIEMTVPDKPNSSKQKYRSRS